MAARVWHFENQGRVILIKRDEDKTLWITGGGISNLYVPLIEMLGGLHGKRKINELKRELGRLKTEEDVTGYLRDELGGKLGFMLAEVTDEEDD